MRYVLARYRSYKRDLAYRIYLTDAQRTISENTAKRVAGVHITKRFASAMGYVKEDTRSGEEIAADVIKKAGLVVKHESI